jgi:hypothetical protein
MLYVDVCRAVSATISSGGPEWHSWDTYVVQRTAKIGTNARSRVPSHRRTLML